MRGRLASLEGRRIRVHGKVKRFGTTSKGGRDGRRVLLSPVVAENGTPLAEHMWIAVTAAMAALDPRVGTVIAFDGRVTRYRRVGGGEDLELSRPTRVAVVALPVPRRAPTPAEQLRAHLKAGNLAVIAASHLLTRLHRSLVRGDNPADWYALLLATQGAMGRIGTELWDARALAARLDPPAPDQSEVAP